MGYFDKIRKSDIFVFLDTVQFEKGSFINRNQITINDEKIWLTIPIKKDHRCLIKNIKIDNSQNWRKKHIKTIDQNCDGLEKFYQYYPECDNLSDLLWVQFLYWISKLEIKTFPVRASNWNFKGQGSELILNICKHFEATTYLSGKFGKDYLNERKFKENSIEVEYQTVKEFDLLLDRYRKT